MTDPEIQHFAASLGGDSLMSAIDGWEPMHKINGLCMDFWYDNYGDQVKARIVKAQPALAQNPEALAAELRTYVDAYSESYQYAKKCYSWLGKKEYGDLIFDLNAECFAGRQLPWQVYKEGRASVGVYAQEWDMHDCHEFIQRALKLPRRPDLTFLFRDKPTGIKALAGEKKLAVVLAQP